MFLSLFMMGTSELSGSAMDRMSDCLSSLLYTPCPAISCAVIRYRGGRQAPLQGKKAPLSPLQMMSDRTISIKSKLKPKT